MRAASWQGHSRLDVTVAKKIKAPKKRFIAMAATSARARPPPPKMIPSGSASTVRRAVIDNRF